MTTASARRSFIASTFIAAAVATASFAAAAAAAPADPTADNPFNYFFGDADAQPLRYADDVPSPEQFLGYSFGEDFIRTHEHVAYAKALADASDRVTVERYGMSHQRRELIIATITSPENHARLDEILERNRELTDPRSTSPARAREIARDNPAVVWLSYNVHGNEASCTNAAMQVMYTLAAGEGEHIERILDDLVVVIDPCLNPDGRARYINNYVNRRGVEPDPNPESTEHREPWPSGRSNHYMFDLNRDWTWTSQPESASRLKVYRRYMPQMHVDYHEQGINSPYFFGAGDTPYNLNIPAESREWFDRYGMENAKVFDRNGLVYASRERFDYLYPGYGKVTPVYHGAVSLLTEQAGHGRAGLVIDVDDTHGPGLTITLEDRVRNHFLTSMSYIETTQKWRREQLERFYRYFAGSMETPDGANTAFVFHADNDQGELANLWRLMDTHGIEIHHTTRDTTLRGALPYHPPFAATDVDLPAGSWVIPAGQPKGIHARVLLERVSGIEDPDTYDITSWPTPAMYGLDAWEYRGDVEALPTRRVNDWSPDMPAADVRGDDLALLVPSDDSRFPRALAAAAEHNLFARLTDDTMVWRHNNNAETIVPGGSLLVHISRNAPNRADLDAFIDDVEAAGLPVIGVDRGVPDAGDPIGNNSNRRFIVPRIVLVRESPFSSLSVGHTWHMLDIQSPTPYTMVNADRLGSLDWHDYNVLVLPAAWSLGSVLNEREMDELKDWVRQGGTIVAIGRSAWWASSELLGLESDENVEPRDDDPYARPGESRDANENVDETGGEAEQSDTDEESEERKPFQMTYAEREAKSVEDRVPGAVLSATVDTTHPLAKGLDEHVAFHVFSGRALPVGDNGFVVARFGEPGDDRAPRIGGVISDENLGKLAGTPAITHHSYGGGNVICFASDPTNRAINKAGMRSLLHAILLGPSSARSLQPLETRADAAGDDIAREDMAREDMSHEDTARD